MTQLPLEPAAANGGAAALQAGKRTWWRKGLWVGVIAFLIFVASSRSQVVAPGITRIDDKFGHFIVYGLLGTLVCRLGRGWRGAGWALLVASVYGASDEWHQSFVPGRSPDVRDWIADTLGAAVAIALYTGWPRYRRWLETPIWQGRARIEKSGTRPSVGGQ